MTETSHQLGRMNKFAAFFRGYMGSMEKVQGVNPATNTDNAR